MTDGTAESGLAAIRTLHERDYREVRESLEAIQTRVDDIWECLLGNGRQGVMTRLALLEQRNQDLQRAGDRRHRTALVFYGAVIGIIAKLLWTMLVLPAP